MSSQIRLSRTVQELLRCPVCRARLKQTERKLVCVNPGCGIAFPIVDGVPVLLDDSLDGLIAQAVLEHVVDPFGCAAESHRVLKPQGLVYAETAFMQQVHGGRYDFTRFTHLRPAPDREARSAGYRVGGLLPGTE